MKRRFLPNYVTAFRDRHGKERLRFRRKGHPSHYFKSPLGTEDFRTEYRACMDRETAPPESVSRHPPGSIGDLVCRYCSTPERLGPTTTTQAKVRSILDKFRTEHGDKPANRLTFEHVDAIIAKKRQKCVVEGRTVGGIEAARKLRKELVRLFDFAEKAGFVTKNPARQADRVKVAPGERSKGYHTWTEDEIARYRAHWNLGTKQRLAMELLLWTDQRKIDTIHLGRQHIEDGRFVIRQTKTGKTLYISIAPQLLEAIVAMPPGNRLCFLVTEWGKPFSVKGFGGWFRDQCDAAGLPGCTAHGLRKATMRRMAELDMGNQTMKSMSGHTKDDEVARYTAEANQKRMADTAVAALSRWEMSNRSAGLDTSAANDG